MLELNSVEKEIIELLKKGYSQSEIAKHFSESIKIQIGSVSSVEKTIQSLKKRFQVKTMFQLGMVVERMEVQ